MRSRLINTFLILLTITSYIFSQDSVSEQKFLNEVHKTIQMQIDGSIGKQVSSILPQDSASVSKFWEEVSKAIKMTINESIGKQAPSLSIQDVKDSSLHELSEYRGKVVLLNFWSRGCKPCIAEIPDISYLQDEYEKAGLKVIFLGPPDFETQQRFFKIYEISGMKAQISGDHWNYPFLYRLGAVPTLILIDRNGVIKDAWLGAIGYAAMENKINTLIPSEAKSFKLRNPRLVLLSSIAFVGLCLIVIAVVWNNKRKKAA